MARILVAPLVWLATFTAIYALHGLICGHDIDGAVLGVIPVPRLLIASAYLMSILAQALLLWALHTPRFESGSAFVVFVSRATGWVGLVATLWSMAPAVTTTYCL